MNLATLNHGQLTKVLDFIDESKHPLTQEELTCVLSNMISGIIAMNREYEKLKDRIELLESSKKCGRRMKL